MNSTHFTDWQTSGRNARFGIENELILPFNRNKWSILLQPTYQYFRDSVTIKSNVSTDDLYSIDYQSIELQLGVRYYAFLNENSKLFANILFVNDVNLNGNFMIE